MTDQAILAFLQAYKQLEQLCNQSFGCKNGVTYYIDCMRNAPNDAWDTVPGWREDFHKLKRLRHIRNQLTHEVDAFDRVIITDDDSIWLHTFQGRIQRHTDPLSQYRTYRPSCEENPFGCFTLAVITTVLTVMLTLVLCLLL